MISKGWVFWLIHPNGARELCKELHVQKLLAQDVDLQRVDGRLDTGCVDCHFFFFGGVKALPGIDLCGLLTYHRPTEADNESKAFEE